jgi:hypothetical protein
VDLRSLGIFLSIGVWFRLFMIVASSVKGLNRGSAKIKCWPHSEKQ